MELQTFTIFNFKIQSYLERMLTSVDSDIDEFTTPFPTTNDIEEYRQRLFNKVYIYPPEIKIKEVNKDLFTQNVDKATAAKLIPDLPSDISTDTVPVTEVWYDIEVEGGISLVTEFTVDLEPMEVRGTINGNKIRLQYHFLHPDADVIGPIAIQQKEALTELLLANNLSIRAYLDANQQFFMDQIGAKLALKVAHNNARAQDRAKI